MARLTKRLTDRGIARRREGLHLDGDGLYLQVTAGGAKSWLLRTMINGKRRDMGLGSLSAVSLAEARETADKWRKIARQGGDPIAARDAEIAAKRDAKTPPTFRKAAETVHTERAPSWRNEKHRAQWLNTLKEYAFPEIGDRLVSDISSDAILKVLAPIWLTKPETARRVRQRIGAVMAWAKVSRFRQDNPVDDVEAGLPKQTDKVKHQRSLPYQDLPGFIAKVHASEADASTRLAFEFLILTAARTGEVLYAKWPEIDGAGEVWTVSADRMKAKREHAVPLSARCREIIEQAGKLGDGKRKGYIFPARREGKPLSNAAFLMTLRRMKLEATGHGFRSTFRVWAAEQTSFPREVAEACLAHTLKDATEAAYMRSTFFVQRAKMMEAWATYANTPQVKAEVIVFPKDKAGKRPARTVRAQGRTDR